MKYLEISIVVHVAVLCTYCTVCLVIFKDFKFQCEKLRDFVSLYFVEYLL